MAEEEAEDGLAVVIAMKVTTLGQETGMVAVGALAGETEAEVVVTETGMTTMRAGPPVKIEVVAGLSRRTGMPAKREAPKEIKFSHKASPAGGVHPSYHFCNHHLGLGFPCQSPNCHLPCLLTQSFYLHCDHHGQTVFGLFLFHLQT